MILLDCCLSTGVATKNGAAEPAAVGKTDVSGVGGTTGGFSPPPGGGVAIAERESKSTVRKLSRSAAASTTSECVEGVHNQFIIDVRDLGDVEWSRYRDTNGSCCRRGRSLARASALGAV